MQEVKRQLRKELIAKRRAMPPEEKSAADKAVYERLKPLIDRADSVFVYVSTEIEVDTRQVMQYCFDKGIPVATPVSGETELFFYPVRSFEELAKGRFGIMEPIYRDTEMQFTEKSLCIVPALCADGNGYRLGYGRGYYDRFLERFSGQSVIICYSTFRMEVPAEPHDKQADFTIFDDTLI